MSKRNVSVDIVRLLAAFGVIAIHVPYNTPAAESVNKFFSPLCVPFFFAVSLTYFVSGLNPQKQAAEVLKKIGLRIALPYLAWTVVYSFLIFFKSRFIGLGHSSQNDFKLWSIIFYGNSAVQLYYLPNLIILQAFAFSIYSIYIGNSKAKLTGVIILLISIFFIVWGQINNTFGVLSWLNIIFYMVVAFVFAKRTKDLSLNKVYVFIGLFLIVFTESFHFPVSSIESLNHIPIGGLGLLLLTLGLPKQSAPQWLITLCATSYGIYLSHVVFLEGFEFLLKKLHLNFQYDLAHELLMTSIIFICSISLTLALRQTKLTKSVFLGE